jgi:UV DNA damage endonuclease
MVLDVHHHLCNQVDDDLSQLLLDTFKTWKAEILPPKLHFSSLKEGLRDREHADYIDGQHFIDFIEICQPLNQDIDVMIEAKLKDFALFDLVKSIKNLRKHWQWIDDSTFER